MKWICLDCNWTGRYGELTRIGHSPLTGSRDELEYMGDDALCPVCGSDDVETADRDPDPLDEHNADYVRDGLQAVRSQL